MNNTELLTTHWQLAPTALNTECVQGVDDIHQCISNILLTMKGTDILRPDFGSDHFRYLDQPEDVALPNMVREITQALERWESRIDVERVAISGCAPAFEFVVTWALKESVYREIYSTSIQQGTS